MFFNYVNYIIKIPDLLFTYGSFDRDDAFYFYLDMTSLMGIRLTPSI